MLAYIGHNGLMDFDSIMEYKNIVNKNRDSMILACYSKSYFAPKIRKAKANPVLWTTHLMTLEACTLKPPLMIALLENLEIKLM
ncbi:hypothetical protein ACWGOQ_0012955 [Aquimarina sp. M1]